MTQNINRKFTGTKSPELRESVHIIPVEFDEYDVEDLLDVVFEQRDCKDCLQWLQNQEEDPQELDFC